MLPHPRCLSQIWVKKSNHPLALTVPLPLPLTCLHAFILRLPLPPQTAVDACLERVLNPAEGVSPCPALAVIFFEGHDPVAVQDALRSFADRCVW